MMGSCSCSAASVANSRHSTYSLRYATIAYPWHPLFGRTLQVSPHRRGKDPKCIYTEERPDLSRELPNWMFDESCCVGMTLGPPEISIEGLNELATVLASLGKTQPRGARSRPSKKKEKDGAEKTISKSSAARSGTRTAKSPAAAMGDEPERADRNLGRSSVGSPGRGEDDEDGRRG